MKYLRIMKILLKNIYMSETRSQSFGLEWSWVVHFVSFSDKCNECEKQAIRGGYLGEHERAEHEARSWGPGTDCAILMRRIRFVHFFSLIWVLWYTFSGVEMLVWSWKEFRCHCSMCALNLRKLWWSDYTEWWGYLYWSNSWGIPWL